MAAIVLAMLVAGRLACNHLESNPLKPTHIQDIVKFLTIGMNPSRLIRGWQRGRNAASATCVSKSMHTVSLEGRLLARILSPRRMLEDLARIRNLAQKYRLPHVRYSMTALSAHQFPEITERYLRRPSLSISPVQCTTPRPNSTSRMSTLHLPALIYPITQARLIRTAPTCANSAETTLESTPRLTVSVLYTPALERDGLLPRSGARSPIAGVLEDFHCAPALQLEGCDDGHPSSPSPSSAVYSYSYSSVAADVHPPLVTSTLEAMSA